jgi:hypothetical protein
VSVEEEIKELLHALNFLSDKLTVVTAFASLTELEEYDITQIRMAAVEAANSFADVQAAVRRLNEQLAGPRRGTGELKIGD